MFNSFSISGVRQADAMLCFSHAKNVAFRGITSYHEDSVMSRNY